MANGDGLGAIVVAVVVSVAAFVLGRMLTGEADSESVTERARKLVPVPVPTGGNGPATKTVVVNPNPDPETDSQGKGAQKEDVGGDRSDPNPDRETEASSSATSGAINLAERINKSSGGRATGFAEVGKDRPGSEVVITDRTDQEEFEKRADELAEETGLVTL